MNATENFVKSMLQSKDMEPLTEKQLAAVAELIDRYADACCKGMRRLLAEEAERAERRAA